MPLGGARQQTPGSRQRAMVANGSEDVAKFALPRSRIANTVGRQQRQLKRASNFDGSAVAGFLLAMKMSLQFHINVFLAKHIGQAFDRASRFFHTASGQRDGQRTVIAASKADQSAAMFLQFFHADCTFAFLRAQLHFGNQAAEVLVAGAARNEEGKAESD